jgi:endonuclease/exonuclease/phosphatase family metal-dependent hydrolase
MSIFLTRRDALLGLLAAGSVITGRRPSEAEALIELPPIDPELCVLFFNTHLLPAIAQSVAGHRGQDDYRTSAIGAAVAPYDLMGLCEVFESHRREEIVRSAQAAAGTTFHIAESPKPTGRHLIGGGLLLLSRLPIEGEPHHLTYRSASRFMTSGLKSDGFAAKGVLHAQLLVADSPSIIVDCFLTHLESVSAEARADQVSELAEFIAAHSSPDRLAILMGDLNVTADFPVNSGEADSEYRQLTNSLRQHGEPLVDLWSAASSQRGGTSDALAAGECRRIDYVLLSPPGPRTARWEAREVRVEPFLDAKVKQGSLSDHAGLSCRLTVRT